MLLGTLLFSSAAFADHATTGPDFVGASPRRHIDKSLVASNQTTRIDPGDVVAFAHDKAVLTAAGYDQVDAAAIWLKSHPRHKLVLEGHTDLIGVAPYNEDLATRRIDTVRRRLFQHGIHSDRIIMITYGEREAIIPDNPADRRVVMFTTTMSPQAVIAMTMAEREAVIAAWTEKGAMLTLASGVDQVPVKKTVVGRR